MKDLRRIMQSTNVVIKLNTDNAVTYWYPISYEEFIYDGIVLQSK